MKNKVKNYLENYLIPLLWIIFLFFLSRRGGNSKNKVAILIMIVTIVYLYKNKLFSYLEYKKEIFIGGIYCILVFISYSYSPIKNEENFYIMLQTTLYSVIFLLVASNYKIKNEYVKYIIPLLLFTSIPPVFRGIKDVYLNFEYLKSYRIHGGDYTSRYALELGIYFLISFFSFFYYKNKLIKFYVFLYTIIILILIFFTQSRTIFIMLPLTIIFIFFLNNFKKGLLTIFIVFISLLIILKIPNVPVINRITSTITSLKKIKEEERYGIYLKGIKEIKNHIFKGTGFNSFSDMTLEVSPNEKYVSYHNLFLETSITQGFINFIFYFIFLALIIFRLIKNYFLEIDIKKKIIRSLALTSFILLILFGMFEMTLYFTKVYQLVFTIVTISFMLNLEKNIKNEKGYDKK